jgi:hypothetical protein
MKMDDGADTYVLHCSEVQLLSHAPYGSCLFVSKVVWVEAVYSIAGAVCCRCERESSDLGSCAARALLGCSQYCCLSCPLRVRLSSGLICLVKVLLL